MKANRKMWTCNRLDLESLGPWPTIPKNFHPMIGENRQLVTDGPVEFEKYPVDVQDYRKITDHFRGMYRIYPNSIKENRRMWTCNRSDLQTLRSQPIMPKNLSVHCFHRQVSMARPYIHGSKPNDCHDLMPMLQLRYLIPPAEANTTYCRTFSLCPNNLVYLIGCRECWRADRQKVGVEKLAVI